MVTPGKAHEHVAVDQGRRALLYYDGYCGFCRRTATWVERLDWFGVVTVRSFRHDVSYRKHGIALTALEDDMHVVVLGTVYRGFGGVIALARRLPLFWALVPVFLLVARAGLGTRAYRLLADNRVIVADSGACGGAGECPLDHR